jgi:hypothetical protein
VVVHADGDFEASDDVSPIAHLIHDEEDVNDVPPDEYVLAGQGYCVEEVVPEEQ